LPPGAGRARHDAARGHQAVGNTGGRRRRAVDGDEQHRRRFGAGFIRAMEMEIDGGNGNRAEYRWNKTVKAECDTQNTRKDDVLKLGPFSDEPSRKISGVSFGLKIYGVSFGLRGASVRTSDRGASVRTLPHHVPSGPNHASLAPAPRRCGDRNPFPPLPCTEPAGPQRRPHRMHENGLQQTQQVRCKTLGGKY
jgi:hypothetical protein